MNPIVLEFANGNVFFFGMGLVVLAASGYLRYNHTAMQSLLTCTWIVGIALVVLSATPFPSWTYAVWLGACVLGLFSLNRRSLPGTVSQAKLAIIAAVMGLSIAMGLMEARYHRLPSIAVSGTPTVFVLGDSISAGTVENERSWPLVLGDLTQLKVINLAQPGATVASAQAQAGRISNHSALIILEIGGNDLLDGRAAKQFHLELDALLAKLAAGKHQVVMFELPGIPFHNAFGAAQRALARQHRITLIPKSCMTRIFSLASNTVDGIHLSQAGHNALATAVFQMLKAEAKH